MIGLPFLGISKYGNLEDGIPLFDTLIIDLKEKDTISIGKYAVSTEKKMGKLKTGYWKIYYSNNILKEEGEYGVGKFIDCGVGGTYYRYNNYRTGVWKYYKENGELKCKISYYPDTLLVENSCGRVKIVFGLIKNFSKLQYLYNLTADEIFQLQKLRTEDEHQKMTLIPISGVLVFEYDDFKIED
ncbi:hypothetical protein [Bernardetia litoralis]|nr:hypothetical protein [Bernardetia litoralis]